MGSIAYITQEATGAATAPQKGTERGVTDAKMTQKGIRRDDAAQTTLSNTQNRWKKVVDTSEIDYSLGAVTLALDKASVGLASIEDYALTLRSLMAGEGRQGNEFIDKTLGSLLLSIYMAMDYTNEARERTDDIYQFAALR
jgi:hypothetical protein